MRMAFGLVSVLVTIGIIILVLGMMLDQRTGSIPVAINAREEAKQIAGIGQDGEAATQSAYFTDGESGGKFSKLIVKHVVPGGAYDTYFGLQKDDEIVEIEQSGSMMTVRDISNGDGGLARALVSDAYARNQRIVVVRNGERITLPQTGPAPAAPPAAPAATPAGSTAGATPAPAPGAQPANTSAAEKSDDSGTPLSRQLDLIKGAGN